MVKLKTKEVANIRDQLLAQQSGLCALCHELIEPGKAVLDHDHKTGHIRGVLHRGCNSMEGIITNNLARNLITPTRLTRILQGYQQYQNQRHPWIHPSHLTAEERAERTKTRAKRRRVAKKQQKTLKS